MKVIEVGNTERAAPEAEYEAEAVYQARFSLFERRGIMGFLMNSKIHWRRPGSPVETMAGKRRKTGKRLVRQRGEKWKISMMSVGFLMP